MAKFLFEITLIVEAEDETDADMVAHKITNYEFPKEIEEKIDYMEYKIIGEC